MSLAQPCSRRRVARLSMGTAVLGTCVLPWTVASLRADDPATLPTSGPRALSPLATGALLPAYGLGVVDVPEPPAFQATAVAELRECPVELRGVVHAEAAEASEVELDEEGEPLGTVRAGAGAFAVLADGAQSWLLAPGQGVYTARGYLQVSAIEADAVSLQLGGGTHRCRLTGGER